MTPAGPHVFTIPASAPFLPTLITALVEGRLIRNFPADGDPLALASATLYLPTRRACRLAREAFLGVIKGEAAILPRIIAIGDIDEDEIAFAEDASSTIAEDVLTLPQAISGVERKFLLAQLIMKWATGIRPDHGAPLVANHPTTVLALADDLAHLLDDMTTRAVSWDGLDDLVPEEMDKYWQITLEFLKIARDKWPDILAARGAVEIAARRDLLIAAETARLEKAHESPVIAAGSTGSMPSTAKLLATIAGLPRGAVVLPGLDTHLDDPSWRIIPGGSDANGRETIAPAVGHPQFAMHGLLRRIGIAREAVTPLCRPATHGREAYVSEALRPAATTEQWRHRLANGEFSTHVEHATASMAVIKADNAEDEALAIAVALREASDGGARDSTAETAALITPDRALARRVVAALDRWKVPVDDSGGDPLSDVPAGIFARLVAEVALGGVQPVALLALLKHRLSRLGAHEFARGPGIAILERAILRGPRPRPGTRGLTEALTTFRRERDNLHRSDPRGTITEPELDGAADLVEKLAAALAPLEDLPPSVMTPGVMALADIAARHHAVIAALSLDHAGESMAFSGLDGIALADALQDLVAAGSLPVAPSDYPETFRAIISERIVRRPGAPDSRVRILGPLEARLQQADRVVLGGLIEGIWPPEPRSDPWLSRQMRAQLGLDLPERRIGLSAHDFAQALGAREIILSYAAKHEGAPTVASRFLRRLAATAGEARWNDALARGKAYLEWARALDRPEQEPRPCGRPAPKPPLAARPMRLSVTEIEHWLRDPYTIYAKHILRLVPLDPVDTPPGARDRGTVIHGAIGEFSEKFADHLPANPLAELLALGEKHFASLRDYPEARAFWWPRFQRIARWFVQWETARRSDITAIFAERGGKIEIALADRAFTLTARADRIERLPDGSYAIIDFKTGTAPSEKQVRSGLSPQLTLEAAILRNGGFTGIPGGPVETLAYVELKGGIDPGKSLPVGFKDGTPDSHAERARERLTMLVTRFADENMPYASLVHPMWKTRYGDYDHLARVKEWSATGGADDGSAE